MKPTKMSFKFKSNFLNDQLLGKLGKREGRKKTRPAWAGFKTAEEGKAKNM
jgi:hypothetical protein